MPGNEDLYTQIAPGVWGLNVVSKGGSLVDGAAAPSGTQMLYDETGWNRQRGNTQGILLPSAARTSSPTTPIQTNYNAKGVELTLNITAAPNTTDTLNLWLQHYDPVVNSANFGVIATFNSAAGNAIQAGRIMRFLIYPGQTAADATNADFKIASLALPRSWGASVSQSPVSWTYSLSYSLIL